MELAPFGEVCAFQSAAIFLFGSLQFTTKSRTSGKIVHTTEHFRSTFFRVKCRSHQSKMSGNY